MFSLSLSCLSFTDFLDSAKACPSLNQDVVNKQVFKIFSASENFPSPQSPMTWMSNLLILLHNFPTLTSLLYHFFLSCIIWIIYTNLYSNSQLFFHLHWPHLVSFFLLLYLFHSKIPFGFVCLFVCSFCLFAENIHLSIYFKSVFLYLMEQGYRSCFIILSNPNTGVVSG